MSLRPNLRGTAAAIFVTPIACLMTACQPRTEAPPAHDPKAMDIVQRAQSAPEKVEHALVDMKQFDLAVISKGESPFSATEEKRFATYARAEQPDGSLILSDRVDGHSEYAANSGTLYSLQRVGGDAHTNLTFVDGEASYAFLTRFPENISRRALPDEFKGRKGPPSLHWMAKAMLKDAQSAETARLRERELTQGVLCDVIELYSPGKAQPEQSEGRPREIDKRITYYIGVADGLVRRQTEVQGPPGRRNYRETLFTVDTGFVPRDISYTAFEAAVRKLVKDKPLPPVVAQMP